MFGGTRVEHQIRYCVYECSTLDCKPNRKDIKERPRTNMPKVPYAVARSESPNLDFLRARQGRDKVVVGTDAFVLRSRWVPSGCDSLRRLYS